DQSWMVRYLVVATGSWVNRRCVLISPAALGQPDWTEKVLPVSLTAEQVRNSPDVDTELPVSRQHEIEMSEYYGWPIYWSVESMPMPASIELPSVQVQGDPHLRSCREIAGYTAAASDGELGDIADMIIDQRTWSIRYIVVSTGSWLAGHKLLVGTQTAASVSWSDRRVRFGQPREKL
ncbi:MAG: PRC-barrel domain containing protein, partial [Bryobacteraceae bacterium]